MSDFIIWKNFFLLVDSVCTFLTYTEIVFWQLVCKMWWFNHNTICLRALLYIFCNMRTEKSYFELLILNLKNRGLETTWIWCQRNASEIQNLSIHTFYKSVMGLLINFPWNCHCHWKVLGFNKIEKMAYFSHPRIGIHGTQYHLSDLNQGFIFIWNSASFTQQNRLF